MGKSVVDLISQGLLYLAFWRQTARDTAWDIEPPGERCRSPIKPNRADDKSRRQGNFLHLAAFRFASISVSIILKSCAQEGAVSGRLNGRY